MTEVGTAKVLSFPPGRHRAVDSLARRFSTVPGAELPAFLRCEVEDVARRRVALGVSANLARQQALELEAAIKMAIRRLERQRA